MRALVGHAARTEPGGGTSIVDRIACAADSHVWRAATQPPPRRGETRIWWRCQHCGRQEALWRASP